MRLRMSDGNPNACILTYIGRLGAGDYLTLSMRPESISG